MCADVPDALARIQELPPRRLFGLPTAQLESLFETAGPRLTDECMQRLVFLYLVRLEDNAELEKTKFNGMFNVKQFISRRPELFYFNLDILRLIVEYLRGAPNSLKERYRLGSVPDPSDEISILVSQHLGMVSELFQTYIRRLVSLQPSLVIDDLMAEVLSRTAAPNNRSAQVDLVWIHYLLSGRLFSRGMLRLVFRKLVYFEPADRGAVFLCLGDVLDRYAQSDGHIRYLQLVEAKADAENALRMLANLPSDQSNCAIDNLADNLADNLTDNLTDNSNDNPTDKTARSHTSAQERLRLAEALQASILDIERETGRLARLTPAGPERDFAEASLHGKEDLAKDNVYVLVNLIWEDLRFYLRDINSLTDTEQKHAVELLAKMICLTGDFLWRRVNSEKAFIGRVRLGGPALVRAICESFTRSGTLLPEMRACLANATDHAFILELRGEGVEISKDK